MGVSSLFHATYMKDGHFYNEESEAESQGAHLGDI